MNPAKLARQINEAVVAHQQGDLDSAELLYLAILKKAPRQPDALHLLGVLRDQRGDRIQGIALIRQALAAQSAFPDAHFNLARMLEAAGDAAGAKAHYTQSLALKPDHAKAYNGLGNLYRAQRLYPEACTAFEHAIRFDARLIESYINLCNTYRDTSNEAGILKVADQGLAVDPKRAQLWLLRAEAAFTLGRLQEGWRDYEWRFVTDQNPVKRPAYNLPMWNGEDLTDKGILIWCEQGVGDEIIFATMLAGVATRAKRCVLQTTPRLVPLFARSFPQIEIFSEPVPAEIIQTLQVQSALGSLGQWVRPSFRAFPTAAGYLKADGEKTSKLRAKYTERQARSLLVGLAWKSSNVTDAIEKTVGLDQWGAILSVPGITFVNLQYGDNRQLIAAARTEFGAEIIDDTEIDALSDLDGFAAQVAALDIVVSSSNTAAHMAGGLGVPVLCMVPRALGNGRRWYWFGEGSASPWYRSMTLFRQTHTGTWNNVVADVGLTLAEAAADAGVLDRPEQFLQRLAGGYKSAGMSREALRAVERAVRYAPASADLYNLQGMLLAQMGRLPEAATAYQRAISIAPARAEIHNNLGTALRRVGRNREATESYTRAHNLNPDHPSIYHNYAMSLSEINQLPEALAALDRLIAMKPDYVDAQYNRALVLLGLGRFAEGWAAFRWRMKRGFVHVRYEDFPQPVWSGEDLTGKHILVWTDLGLGDEILLAGIIPDLAAVARRVTLLCSERLVTLFRRSFPGITVDTRKSPLPAPALSKDIDFQMSIAELGMALRSSVEAFPNREKYLAVGGDLRDRLRRKYLATAEKNLLVGISWRSINPEIGAQKSLPLSAWLPILKVPGVTFVNLQYGNSRDEIEALRREHNVDIIDDNDINTGGDMDPVAAQVAAMDQVISISNTTVHIAGAAGVPVWVLLPQGHARLWYWFRGLEGCVWYPKAKLIPSHQEGDWKQLIGECAANLARLASNRP